MEKIFIIGGSGFIGKNLVEELETKYEISVFDKFIDADFFSHYTNVRVRELNLVEDKIPLSEADPDYIINLASIVTADRDMSLFDSLISSNLKILINLYDRYKDSARLKLMIQFGSSEEYGNAESPFKESQREEPNSPYSLVKQLTVNTSMMLHRNYGFPIMAVRPGNLFGRYQSQTKFLPYVVSQLISGGELNVTPCEQKRDFIYADDFAYCIRKLIENHNKCAGEIVNVSSGTSISLKSIIEYLKKETSSVSVINYGAIRYRENEMMDLRCSTDKLEQIIGERLNFDFYKQLTRYIKSL